MATETVIHRVARVLYDTGAYCGNCQYEGWDSCSGCRECVLGYAVALSAAGLLRDFTEASDGQ